MRALASWLETAVQPRATASVRWAASAFMETTASGMRRTSSHTHNLRRDRPLPEIGRDSLYPRYSRLMHVTAIMIGRPTVR